MTRDNVVAVNGEQRATFRCGEVRRQSVADDDGDTRLSQKAAVSEHLRDRALADPLALDLEEQRWTGRGPGDDVEVGVADPDLPLE